MRKRVLSPLWVGFGAIFASLGLIFTYGAGSKGRSEALKERLKQYRKGDREQFRGDWERIGGDMHRALKQVNTLTYGQK